jgi:methionyl-tRNA formyltransferase
MVSCGRGSLKVIDVKAAGKSTMAASAWLNGAQPKPGESFK